MGPVDTPPFYAIRIELGDLGTKGGIKVDLSLVKTGDIEAGNGVIHTVHKLILVP